MAHKKYLQSLRNISLVAIALLLVGSIFTPGKSSAAFNGNNIMDDFVFDNAYTMSTNDIQNFLNGFANSCIKNYQAPYPHDYFTYGGNVSAATVIRRAADLWSLNPQVILATLEKEQSLVSGNAGCAGWRYNSAMGQGCPDGGECPAPPYAGFHQQVTKGAWQLKFNKERAYGNIAWNGDGSVPYYGFMTEGVRSRRSGEPAVYYSGVYPIDGQSVRMENGTTASLYSYTPHFHGNQNFVLIFERWFGTVRANDTSVPHPNGALISDGQYIYRIENGTRRHLSAAAFNAYGYNWSQVKPASTGDRNTLIPGAPLWVVPAGTVFTANDGKAYVADDRSGVLKKQWISAATFTALGYNWSQVIPTGSSSEIPTETEPGLLENTRHPSGTIIKFGNEVYFIDRYTLRYVTAVAFVSNSFRWERLVEATNGDKALVKSGSLDLQPGTILYSGGNIYVTDKDSNGIFKRPFGPYECFANRLHYNSGDWISVPAGALPVRTGGTFSC